MSYINKNPSHVNPNAPVVNKGQPDFEKTQKSWQSDFSTNRQEVEKITVEESLDIIEKAQTSGFKVAVKTTSSPTSPGGIPTATTLDGSQISLRVRDAKAVEDDQKKAGPAANPFLNKNAKAPPKQKSLSELP